MAHIFKTTYRYVQYGQSCDFGLHYQWDGDTGSDEPAALDLATRLDSHLRDAFKRILSTGSTLTDLLVRQELAPGDTSVPDVAVLGINESGTGYAPGAGTGPAEVVPLFHRKSAGAVRGGQSWAFGASPEGNAAITGARWDTGSTLWSLWGALAALLDDDIAHGGTIPGISGTYHPICYARTRRARGIEPFTFKVVSASVDPRPRWLRSRRA